MTARYFQMRDDVHIERRWYLDTSAEASGMFSRGMPVGMVDPVPLTHSDAVEPGNPVDYIELSSETVPVVHRRVAQLFQHLAPNDVQLVPATVEGLPEQYFIVNVLKERRCIDEAACLYVSKYTEADRSVFPDLVGSYFRVSGLKIDKSKVEDARVFRTWGWVAIIVAEEIKIAFEAAHVKGAKFVEV